MNEREESSLASWSAVSFTSITTFPGIHISWTLICSASITRDWCRSHSSLKLLCKLWNILMAVWLSEKFRCSYFLTLFYIFRYAYLDGINFNLEHHGVEPKSGAMPFSEPHFYTPSPMPSLVLGQASSPLLSGLNRFWYLGLLGSWSLNSLWYANRNDFLCLHK